ncbi:MAG TPA: hypothetical protein VIX37_17410 [Candidatus Sulfotelmatobacter sp.]
MNQFIAKFGEQIIGVLSGFDRLVLRGTLRAICYEKGMEGYLSGSDVRLKDFAGHVQEVSRRLRQASLALAEKLGRTVRYLASSEVNKEAVAKRIAAEQKISEGLVCVLTCVETCQSFEVHRNAETKRLELVSRRRKCLFLYHYSIHPALGFLNARIQTWFPFSIQICLNGREWLARQMDAEGLRYLRQDNCFPWIEDFARAQELMNAQLRTRWPEELNAIARQLNPLHDEIFHRVPVAYYWSTYQSEWASDIVFREAAVLRRLYPLLIQHALTSFGSPEVLRFLGRRTRQDGQVPRNFDGEVGTDLCEREEGVRIKHRVNGNSLKLYDKAYTPRGSVLRPEMTMNHEGEFRVYRAKEGDPQGPQSWRVLRRGMADLHRRAKVSQQANERYLEALAKVDDTTRLEEVIRPLERRREWKGKRVRALRPFQGSDLALLEAIGHGEFFINGFRNKNLQGLLFTQAPNSGAEKRRRSARVSRQIRLLRAHGLIRKVAHENRYHVTKSGRQIITAVLAARQATVSQLLKAA